MATTTNYSWTTPDNTAYVKDGASAIRTLGSSVDTTLFTALGGAYPGLRLIKKQTIGSAVSSVTVTGAFSSTYDNYRIVVSGGAGSTTSYAVMTLGSTVAGYNLKTVYGAYTTTTLTGAGSSNTASWAGVVKGTTSSINGTIELQLPNAAKVTGIDFVAKETASGGFWEQGSGFLNDTTQYTAFTLSLNAGTWTGGTIYVYGYGVS